MLRIVRDMFRLRQIRHYEPLRQNFVGIYGRSSPVFGVNLQGVVCAMNGAAERVTGFREFHAIGRPLGELVQCFGGVPAPSTGSAVLPRGVRLSHEPLQDHSGRCVGFLVFPVE